MNLWKFISLKVGIFALKCAIAHSIHLNAMRELKSGPLGFKDVFCILDPFKSYRFQLKWALLVSIVPLHPRSTQVTSFWTQIKPHFVKWAFAHSNQSNQVFFNSNVPMHPQTIQIKFFATQKYLCALNIYLNKLDYTKICTIVIINFKSFSIGFVWP